MHQKFRIFNRIRPVVSNCIGVFIFISIVSCGESNNQINSKRLGEEDSLHRNIESIALLELANRGNGIPLAQAESIRVEEVETEKGSLATQKISSVDQSNLYNQFEKHPGSVITARTYKTSFLESRDECLQSCVNDPICGSVSYLPLLGECIHHGPNMPWYEIHTSSLNSIKGLITPDTYVIPNRKGTDAPLVNFIIGFTAGEHGIRGGTFVKLLYTDKTASPWVNYLPQDKFAETLRKLESVQGGKDIPFKDVEAMIVGIDKNIGKYSFAAVFNSYWDNVNLQEYAEENSPAAFRFFNYFFSLGSDGYDGVTVDSNCEDKVNSSCIDMLVLPVQNDSESEVNLESSDKPYQILEKYRKRFAY